MGIDWREWITTIPLWMTETNCNHKPWGITNVEACQGVTGQWKPGWGVGGMVTYEQNPQFERLAWWSVISDILAAEGSNMLNW